MKMKKLYCYWRSMSLTVVLTIALTACDKGQQASETASAVADQAVSQSPVALAANPTATKGKIVETMDVSGYTYIQIDNGSGNYIWAAIPKTKLKIGEEITLQGGTMMRNFTSKTLNRTFESIIFASGVIRGNGGKVVAATVGSASKVVTFSKLKIEKADAANAQTVADVFRQGVTLDTQEVTIKGQVVKVSRNIMGKNWLHLQDGTGDPSQNTHDLVITTSDTAEKGAIVTIKGTVAADKDFGAGYKYDVIILDATVAAQ